MSHKKTCCEPFECSSPIDLDIKVFLEGSYVDGTGEMRTDLNSILPTVQPYPNSFPFLNTVRCEMYHADAVDWVLVKLRSLSNDPSTTVLTIPGLLLKDGSIEFCQENLCNDNLGLDLTIPYEITVQHRNHLGIASPSLVSFVGNTLTFDFTTQDSFTSGFGSGQKLLVDGSRVMYGGNTVQLTIGYTVINSTDLSLINNNIGSFGYNAHDASLDGITDNADVLLYNSNQNVESDVLF